MDIKLKDFEGPLDLLLHLVSKYQVDIYDVPIVDVIEQYLAYITTLQTMKLEVASGYMVMASQLMLVKSRRLLPKIVEQDSQEDSPEQELLDQIEEYRRFKLLSQEIADKHDQRAKLFSKPKQELIFEEATLSHDKTVMDLFLAFSKLMAEKQEAFKANHKVIERDDYRIEDMMTLLQQRLTQQPKLTLTSVFHECQNIQEMLTIFLATLELIKMQSVEVEQKDNFGEIILHKKEPILPM